MGAVTAHTFKNVTAPHTISATFVAGPAPVVWYKFDEKDGTTAVDSSGNARNATLLNGPTWVEGKYGNAVNLNGGNQYASCPPGLVSSLTNFTISAWVYLNANPTWSRIFDFGTGTGVYMFLSPRGGADRVRYAITTAGNGAEQRIDGPTVLPAASWQHVAVTLNGTAGTLYVNGVPVGTNTGMTLNPSSLGNTTQNYIGKSQWNDPYFNGLVDDFRIYANALSAAEVQAVYHGSRAITASAGPGGSISPSGPALAAYGGNRTFTVTPNPDFVIASVTVDGVNRGAITAYTFSNVIADHTIAAQFAAAPPPSLTVLPNGGGNLDIVWPDNYSGRLLWTPVLGPNASWEPVEEIPAHIPGFYRLTVVPDPGAAFYALAP